MRTVHFALALVASASLSSCFFNFDRLSEIEPGSVSGRTVDGEAAVIQFSRIGLDSTPRVLRSADNGTFDVQGLTAGAWLLRFASDADGNGEPDQAAVRAVQISTGTDPAGNAVLSSVLLGDVTLDGTGTLLGRVVDIDGNVIGGARVVVFRNTAELDPDQIVGAGSFDVDLGAEQETASDSDGNFRVAGVARGTVRVAAVDEASALASDAVEALANPGRETQVDDVVLLPSATRSAQVEIANPPTDGTVRVDVVRHGGSHGDPADLLVSHSAAAARSIAGFEVPTTIVDVYVTDVSPTGADRRSGVMAGRAVPHGTTALLWGSVELIDTDPCGDPADRDHDGTSALPNPSDDLASWAQCSAQCTAFGTGAPASCSSGNDRFDCDDDDDGQPDVTEPFACVSLCRGTDLDGDGMCSTADPFPGCAANDAADAVCSADEHEFTEPPSRYDGTEGEGEGEGEGAGEGEGEGEGEGAGEGEGEGEPPLLSCDADGAASGFNSAQLVAVGNTLATINNGLVVYDTSVAAVPTGPVTPPGVSAAGRHLATGNGDLYLSGGTGAGAVIEHIDTAAPVASWTADGSYFLINDAAYQTALNLGAAPYTPAAGQVDARPDGSFAYVLETAHGGVLVLAGSDLTRRGFVIVPAGLAGVTDVVLVGNTLWILRRTGTREAIPVDVSNPDAPALRAAVPIVEDPLSGFADANRQRLLVAAIDAASAGMVLQVTEAGTVPLTTLAVGTAARGLALFGSTLFVSHVTQGVTAFRVATDGTLTQRPGVVNPSAAVGQASRIAVHPSGAALYVGGEAVAGPLNVYDLAGCATTAP